MKLKFGLLGLWGLFVLIGCSPASPSASSYTLTVQNSGNGTVTSSPTGINCGATCSKSFASGTSVGLIAEPSTDYVFSGWSGDCSGTGTCSVSMTTNKNISASFAKVEAFYLNTRGIWYLREGMTSYWRLAVSGLDSKPSSVGIASSDALVGTDSGQIEFVYLPEKSTTTEWVLAVTARASVYPTMAIVPLTFTALNKKSTFDVHIEVLK